MDNFLMGKKYIDLDSLYSNEYLEKQYKGKNMPFIIDGVAYFVKRITDETRAYNELLAEEILKKMGILCVDYQLVKLFGKPCLISRSFIKDDLRIFSGSELLEQCYKDKDIDIDYANNLEMINFAFLNKYRVNQENTMFKNFCYQLYRMFCFDFLFGNKDRKSDNWVIQEHYYKRYDGKLVCDEVNLGILYDNERILEESMVDFAMGINYSDMVCAVNSFITISNHIKNNNDLKAILGNMINKIDKATFLKCINSVEVKIGSNIPIAIKNKLLDSYCLRLEEINKIFIDINFKL